MTREVLRVSLQMSLKAVGISRGTEANQFSDRCRAKIAEAKSSAMAIEVEPEFDVEEKIQSILG